MALTTRKHRHSAVSAIRLPTVDPDATPETQLTAYTAWIAQLYADLTESIDGIALQGCDAVEIGTNSAGIVLSPQISRSAGILRGWSLRETNGAAVTIDFYDVDLAAGQNIAGDVVGLRKICTTALAANGHETIPVPNVSFVGGLGVVFTGTGIVTGDVWINGVD